MRAHRLRNFVLRLSINYILFAIVLLLPGISSDPKLFDTWVIALVFTALAVTVRKVLVTLALPLIIMTAGLFIFVVDVILLTLTAALTRLNVTNFWWALLGVIVMSSASIWVERAFRELGWLSDDEPGAANVLTRRSPPWWVRLTLLAVLLFGVGFSGAMAAQLFLLMSLVSADIVVLTVSAGIGFVCVSFGVAWLVAQGLALERRARFSLVTAIVVTLLIAVPAGLVVVAAPSGSPLPPPSTRPETATWALPSGSEIAYTHVPAAGGPGQQNPVIFLHGLGEAVLDSDIAFFGELSTAGYDVYLYDMVGSGLSSHLDSIEGYTIRRHTQDLEAIREIIGGDRLILIAHAEGAHVALSYTAEHRDRVERVVFYSPAPLAGVNEATRDRTRTAASPISTLASLDVRPWVAIALAYRSPRAAEAYVGQDEMRTWADRSIDPGEWVCFGHRDKAPGVVYPGHNPYVEIVGGWTDEIEAELSPALAKALVPTLLIRGECDWTDPAAVAQYRSTVPYLNTVRIEDAGHMPHLEKPEVVREIVLRFLNS